jgi:hypothetical protein
MEQYKARDIHFLVSGTFAKGQPHWPTSRAALKGLRLRQVSDAIKLFVAQVYIEQLAGVAPREMYDGLKKTWPGLSMMIPMAFVRVEDWQAAQQISDPQARCRSLIKTAAYYSEPTSQNEEEREFYVDETFTSFISYLEALPRNYPSLLAHVLGHLSVRYIYHDDTIPVLNAQV